MAVRMFTAASVAALCAMGSLAHAATPAPGDTLAPAEGQVLNYSVIDEIVTLDPGLIEVVDDSHVARQLFEGLYNQDAQGATIPGVALSHEMSEDGLTYTFALRPEAKWSDGTPVTANDFVYAWQRVVDPATASPYSWYIELMNVVGASEIIAGEAAPDTLGIRAVDDHTLEVTLNAPTPFFPEMLSNSTTFPVPRQAIEAHGDQWTQPGNLVGNGAYVLSERVPQERIVLTRNPEYWDNANTVIEEVGFYVIMDENQALTRWEADEMQIVPAPSGQYPALLEQYPDETFATPLLCTYYYHVNLREDANPALLDVNVRQALNLAIDRQVIAEAILAGGQAPAFTLTHEATAGWEVPSVPAAEMTQEERNAEAQRLMAEAGYGTEGEPLTLEILYNTSESHQQIAVAIGQMWKQTLGVETTLANQEWQTFLDARKEGNYDLARAGWCADYNEPSSFLDIVTSNSEANDSKYLNPEYDAVMEESRTAADPLPLYAQAEAMLAEDAPILPIYFYANNNMIDSSLKGFPSENASETWYAKDMYRVAEE